MSKATLGMEISTRKKQVKIWGLWAVLGVPGLMILAQDALSSGKYDYLRWTGLLSVWFLLVTLAVSPLRRLAPQLSWVRWLRKNRRYLGVASFWYASLHLVYFLKNASVGSFLRSFVRFEIMTGWIAWFIFIALTITSFDAMVRRMGPAAWRRLHWHVYTAAILTAVHWALTSYRFAEMIVYIAPLVLLMVLSWLRASRSSPLTWPPEDPSV